MSQAKNPSTDKKTLEARFQILQVLVGLHMDAIQKQHMQDNNNLFQGSLMIAQDDLVFIDQPQLSMTATAFFSRISNVSHIIMLPREKKSFRMLFFPAHALLVSKDGIKNVISIHERTCAPQITGVWYRNIKA